MDTVCTQLNTFLSNYKLKRNSDWQEIWTLCKFTLQHILVPHISPDRPAEETDYYNYKSLTETRLQCFVRLLELLEQLHNDSDHIELDKEFSGLLVIFCGQHHSVQLWSSLETVRESSRILLIWNQILGRNSINESCSFVLNYLVLKQDSGWNGDPCDTYLFVWLILNVNFIKLVNKEHLVMFSITLRLLDDFRRENQLAGIKCISQIVENVTSADFFQYSLVVNDALIRLLNNPEPDVIALLIPCLMNTFRKTQFEDKPGTGNYKLQFAWSDYDKVFTRLLSLIEHDDGGPMSLSCLQTLALMLEAYNILTVRYHQRLFKLIDKCLLLEDSQKHSQKCHQLSLNVLKVFIKACDDHLQIFSEQISFILLKKKFTLKATKCGIYKEIEEILGMLEDLSVPILNMDA